MTSSYLTQTQVLRRHSVGTDTRGAGKCDWLLEGGPDETRATQLFNAKGADEDCCCCAPLSSQTQWDRLHLQDDVLTDALYQNLGTTGRFPYSFQEALWVL